MKSTQDITGITSETRNGYLPNTSITGSMLLI